MAELAVLCQAHPVDESAKAQKAPRSASVKAVYLPKTEQGTARVCTKCGCDNKYKYNVIKREIV